MAGAKTRNAVLRLAAIREAGQFVAGQRLGIHSSYLSLPSERELETDGHPPPGDSPRDAAHAQDRVTALCAGYGAAVAAGVPEDRAAAGCDSDLQRADEIIGSLALPGLGDQKAAAVALMCEDGNVKAVAAVAEELMASGRVAAELAALVVEHADGQCTESKLERFRTYWVTHEWTSDT